MDKDIKLNSPRTLQACRIKGILPEELYYVEYKDYLSAHPEITNLPEDIKKYRFKLLEKLEFKNKLEYWTKFIKNYDLKIPKSWAKFTIKFDKNNQETRYKFIKNLDKK